MKHLFVINPAAGSFDRTKKYKELIEETCQKRGLTYQIAVPETPQECLRIVRETAATGEDWRIYACGGDGTLNMVVNGAVGYDNVAVSVFPMGSGNDFARIFSDPVAFRDIERLLDPQEVTFDLIRCNDRISLNICSAGLDARIGRDVGQYKRIPFLTGFRAYVVSTLVNVIRGMGEHMVVEIDGQRMEGRYTMVCLCNGRYYGGGFNPVPEADPTDGLMDVLVIRQVTRLQAAGVIGKYKAGRYKELPQYASHFKARDVKITCDRISPMNLDGEILESQKAHFTIAREKLRFFYPKGITWEKI